MERPNHHSGDQVNVPTIKDLEVALSVEQWTDVLNVLQICVQETHGNETLADITKRLIAIRNKISKQVSINVKFSR